MRATTYDDVFDRTLVRPVLLRFFYVVPAMLIFLTWMKLKIEPSMVKIFADFDTQLPTITRQVMRSTSSLESTDALLPLLALAALLVLLLAWLQWTGRAKANLPVLKRLVRWIDAPVVLRVLALAARRDLPLPPTLRALALAHPKRSMRLRVAAAARDVARGQPWADSLRRAGVIERAEAAILDSAERSGNLPWALDELAESLERRANHRLQALAQVVLPLSLVPAGVLIGLLVVAYFAPLTTLIWKLSL